MKSVFIASADAKTEKLRASCGPPSAHGKIVVSSEAEGVVCALSAAR